MIEERQMGSQTLEILRQGVWASLTGGWFYDPHQDVFSNTFHLYIWLFLLCTPFTIYVYFPPTRYIWSFYCLSITVVLTVIKLINYTLHHMYDTSECIREEIDDNWQETKREDEGIELQDLSNRNVENQSSNHPGASLTHLTNDNGILPSTDADSFESTEFQQNNNCKTTNTKQQQQQQLSSTIDLKAEVHRKNSSESSDDAQMMMILPSQDLLITKQTNDQRIKTKHQRSKTDDGLVFIKSTKIHKLITNDEIISDLEQQQQQQCNNSRRHSSTNNFSHNNNNNNNKNNFLQPTGSLELSYIDKNLNQSLVSDNYYFNHNNNHNKKKKNSNNNYKTKNNNNNGTVRRIRSTVLETCCQPQHSSSTLTINHPNSLEIIGCKNTKNPLPPPSTNLIRNQHLNLCKSYYDSDIVVYPIAEQSDEHQTSHGPDTDDLDTPIHTISDSDLDEQQQQQQQQQQQNSTLFCITVKTKNVPYYTTTPNNNNNNNNDNNDEKQQSHDDEISASSKDALIDQSNTTSSTTPEMQDARNDCYLSDNDINNKNNNNNEIVEQLNETTTITTNDNDDDNNKIINNNNTNRKRKRTLIKSKNIDEIDNYSSLIDLDLDWLFDDDYNDHDNDKNRRPNNRQELLKRDNEWSSSTTSISLEHDVNKMLKQEPTPSSSSTHSLGAIPKKSIHSDIIIRNKLPKSESIKCSNCRCNNKIDDKNLIKIKPIKEHKNTQTLHTNNDNNDIDDDDNNSEGFGCIILPQQQQQQQRLRYISSQCNEELSSNGSNNELSTLLPPPSAPLLSAFLNNGSYRDFPIKTCLLQRDNIRFHHHHHHSLPSPSTTTTTTTTPRNRLKRARINRRRSNQKIRRDTAIASSLSAGYGTHCAKNFNDTSDGSVHCFMDEQGNWITYTFDEKGFGIANTRLYENNNNNENKLRRRSYQQQQQQQPSTSRLNQSFEHWDNSNSNSSVSIVLDTTPQTTSMIPIRNLNLPKLTTTNLQRLPSNNNNNHLEINLPIDDSVISVVRDNNNINESSTTTTTTTTVIKNHFKFIQNDPLNNNNNNDNGNNNNNLGRKVKTFYKLKILPKFFIKITLDRLKLLTLLDRNLTIFETILSILLGILVSILGAILLYLNFYHDLLAFIFCFIIASCQYSLLKSVQPDAASPTHGFNRIIAYSRPIYFSILSIIIILLTYFIDNNTTSNNNLEILLLLREFFIKFLLFFPIIFSFGLFPQINTFFMYLLEQIDIYIFGGNAMLNLLSSFYCIIRSIIIIIIMQGFVYGSLYETKQSRHILFSIFCSCLISISYHLSRCTSDPTYLWIIIKQHLLSLDIYREHNNNNQQQQQQQQQQQEQNNNDRVVGEDEENPLNLTNIKKEEKSVKFNDHLSDSVDNTSDDNNNNNDNIDPLPLKLEKTVKARLKNDLLLCVLISILVFSIHASTIFTVLQPELTQILTIIIIILGFILHYIIPQFRKQLPWMCIARPLLRAHELNQYQIREPAKIMWYEKVYVYLSFIERNILYPLLFLSILTEDAPKIGNRYGPLLASFIICICGLKLIRNSYSNQSSQYLILLFTTLFSHYDYKQFIDVPFLIQYFIISIFYYKIYELLLKLQFVVTYIAPWQITWGSAFHAFAQPFSVPHSAMLFLQIIISSILSTPLNPFLGSAIFLTSYIRPIKFWERDYNTRRVDHSNTQLLSHLENNLGCDDNNLNSIFYEHLTRSLQHSLCGDLLMGRWGIVQQGDCFVLASDYLNCLIHIIEMGNGLLTFQMRGLEFRGTYCQQREVEAITEGVEENDACCCIETDHFNGVLSISAAFSQRWLAWEVTASKYILEGYSISDNSAASMLQVFEFRKVLISYYVKSIIFYTTRSPKLIEWLNSPTILKALQPMEHKNFVDLDPIFNANIDEDYDINNSGMTRQQFYQIHGDWICYCIEKLFDDDNDDDDNNRKNHIDTSCNSILVLLCFALSLLGRRALGAVSHNTVSSVEFFLYGLHALFKGDFRITCTRDEWVFIDIDLLKTIVAPGVRMSLKLHQDHFMSPDEYEELSALYDAICKHNDELIISHEGDPLWRNAILNGTPSLLALRHVFDDGTDEYKIIMLNKRYLSFRVIKINKECVRGLWAGQQQELVYLRNRNPERGSIQNAKQALRNIINSSCDQPIGYPIYVSPLTTSYAETNEQYCNLLVGGTISLTKIQNFIYNLFRRIRKRCGEGCSSGGSQREEIGMGHDGIYAMTTITTTTTTTTTTSSTTTTTTILTSSQSIDGSSHLSGSIGRGSSLTRTSLSGNRGSLVSVGKPTSATTLASLATLFKERDERVVSQTPDGGGGGGGIGGNDPDLIDKDYSLQRVRIIDPNLVYDGINLGRRIDVCWPSEYMRLRGGRSFWKDWVPEAGMEGPVIHRWIPCHKDPGKRSHVDRTILLVQIDDKFVPIAESGVQDLGQEV